MGMADVRVHWYPGHMAKARRRLAEMLPQVDAVLEVADARIPRSSRHPELGTMVGARPRLLLLAREDLADSRVTRAWLKALRSRGETVMAADLRRGGWPANAVRRLRAVARKPTGTLRAVVVGIPNVGKSTAINALARRRGTRTGAVPGITRSTQWLSGYGGVMWLDTPGLLWPRLDDPQTRFALAVTGAIPDHLMDVEEVAVALIEFLCFRGREDALAARYGEPEDGGGGGLGLVWLEQVARARGAVAAAGQWDMARAAGLLLHDFRSGRLGRLSLEEPEDFPAEAGP